MGAFGALVKDIVLDNCIILPKFDNGRLLLGSIGGSIIGASVGLIVDHSIITAFFAGYAGSQMLVALAPKVAVE